MQGALCDTTSTRKTHDMTTTHVHPTRNHRLLDKYALNAAALKWIAIFSMTVDHIGAVLLPYTGNDRLIELYHNVGRLAFPIFAFLLVEGYRHTSNKRKYLTYLLIFACISEIPFDLAFAATVFDPEYQNIFFTLTLSLIAIWAADSINTNTPHITWLLRILCVTSCAVISELLHADYGIWGPIVVFLFYCAYSRTTTIIAATLAACIQYTTPAIFFAPIIIGLYNGKRGRQNKWFFYIFYPAHLLVLYGIASTLLAPMA